MLLADSFIEKDTGPINKLPLTLKKFEEEMIRDALKSSRWNQAVTARLLGIRERVMGLHIKKLNINPKKHK